MTRQDLTWNRTLVPLMIFLEIKKVVVHLKIVIVQKVIVILIVENQNQSRNQHPMTTMMRRRNPKKRKIVTRHKSRTKIPKKMKKSLKTTKIKVLNKKAKNLKFILI